MRHHAKGRAFGRPTNQRRALLRSLARSLILHERISTTEAKAKELRPFVERLVTYGKRDTLASRRLARARMGGDDETVTKLFSAIAPRYADRAGGYTRIVKRSKSASDGRKTAYIAFV
ncbi:MAG TPA: 50S ribosomal protein L17 [Candidatus Paceibacterota bacterium]|nr:50S ribosomal protein L17 [Candidatus Paceibacterota bacterium]